MEHLHFASRPESIIPITYQEQPIEQVQQELARLEGCLSETMDDLKAVVFLDEGDAEIMALAALVTTLRQDVRGLKADIARRTAS